MYVGLYVCYIILYEYKFYITIILTNRQTDSSRIMETYNNDSVSVYTI